MEAFKFYSDPGHGWLAVKLKDIFGLGLQYQISNYSYMRGLTVYLEEDCDAALFVRHWESKHGFRMPTEYSYCNKRSIIRSYEKWNTGVAEQVFKKLK